MTHYRAITTIFLLAFFGVRIANVSAFASYKPSFCQQPRQHHSIASASAAGRPEPLTRLLESTASDEQPLVHQQQAEILCDLQTFLRLVDAVPTGGMAKAVIQSGDCRLNGQIETRRAKKLFAGDKVTFAATDFDVAELVAHYGYVYKTKPKKVKPQARTMEDGALEFGGRFRSEEWRKERKERKATRKSRNAEQRPEAGQK